MSDICNLSYQEIVDSQFFKKEPFGTYKAEYLFAEIREENFKNVDLVLKQNPRLVFNRNEDLETALHASVNYCGLSMIKLI